MIIAKNDENKRSRIWRIVTLVSSVLIIMIAVFLLTKMFTTNPLEGRWEDEDGNLDMVIKSNGTLVATVPDLAGEEGVDVKMTYNIDKDAKIVSIEPDAKNLAKVAEQYDGQLSQEVLTNAVGIITSSFEYSVDQEQLTLTEREYGDQLIFIKSE